MTPGALRPRVHTATDTDNDGVGPGPKRPGRRLERVIAMIIRPHGSTRLLITQPDHAALAGRIMESWTADDFAASPRRAEILGAIAKHDDGWHDVDAAPLVDPATGNFLDFIHAPDDVRQAVWPRGVDAGADAVRGGAGRAACARNLRALSTRASLATVLRWYGSGTRAALAPRFPVDRRAAAGLPVRSRRRPDLPHILQRLASGANDRRAVSRPARGRRAARRSGSVR